MSNLGNLKSRKPTDAKFPGVTNKTSQAGMNAVSEDKSKTPTDAKPPYVTSKTSQLPSVQRCSRYLLCLRAKFAWMWHIGLIKRTMAFKWEVDVACLPLRG